MINTLAKMFSESNEEAMALKNRLKELQDRIEERSVRKNLYTLKTVIDGEYVILIATTHKKDITRWINVFHDDFGEGGLEINVEPCTTKAYDKYVKWLEGEKVTISLSRYYDLIGY